jgi:type I restriction enzyme S subunit
MSAFPKYERYKDSGVEWLGEVPEHWEVMRAKRVFQNVAEKGHPNERLLSATQDKGVIPRDLLEQRVVMPIGQLQSFKLVRENDFVISLRSFQGGIEHSAYRGLVSPAYTVLRIQSEGASPGFLRHLLKASSFISELNVSVTGIRQGKNVDYAEFAESFLPIPPKPEQDRIVAFLDRKTTEIDVLIAKKQRQIELLDEQKAILIHSAVTRGLNPNAKLKPSGIEWIGDIPEHWEVLQLRRLQRYGTSITYGIVQAGPNIDDGIPYIRTSDMKGEEFGYSGFLKTSHKIDNAYRRSKVEEGDLVVAIRATLGKALRVPKHLHGANLTQGTAKIAPGPRLDSKFLAYAFNSSYCQKAVFFVGKGTTFLEITLEALRRIQLVVPPMVEQLQIVAAIDKVADLHRESVALTLKEILTLQSLRSTLIAHAVTGRIKV